MTRKLKYVSRIKDEFDTVISGVNGVFMCGDEVISEAVDTLIKLYQSGKKLCSLLIRGCACATYTIY